MQITGWKINRPRIQIKKSQNFYDEIIVSVYVRMLLLILNTNNSWENTDGIINFVELEIK